MFCELRELCVVLSSHFLCAPSTVYYRAQPSVAAVFFRLMSEIVFQLEGLTKEQRDRLNRRLRRRPVRNPVFTLAIAATVGIVAARSGGSAGSFNPNPGATHVAIVRGQEVRADKVLVLVDISGSMRGVPPLNRDTGAQVQYQLNRLQAAGISIENRATVPGFAISFTDIYSMLRAFDERVAASRSVDTVYVISDFSARDDEANTPEAYEHLVATLRDRRLRLYWATVRDDPSPRYYEIARQSGGDVIPVK